MKIVVVGTALIGSKLIALLCCYAPGIFRASCVHGPGSSNRLTCWMPDRVLVSSLLRLIPDRRM